MLSSTDIRRRDRAHSCFPRVSMHTRRLATKTATALLPTPPRGAVLWVHAHTQKKRRKKENGAALARGAVLWVHARTQNKRRKKEKRLSPASNRRRRCPKWSSERPRMGQRGNLRRKKSISKSMLCLSYAVRWRDIALPFCMQEFFRLKNGPYSQKAKKNHCMQPKTELFHHDCFSTPV